jgi:hypothetical protein
MKQYTIEEIRNYIKSQDSLGDVLYNLTEEKIDEANKVIEIVGCLETVDNWGREEQYDAQETYKLLTNPDEWTDDQRFYDECNRCFFIEELIGKKIKVGPFTFTLTED